MALFWKTKKDARKEGTGLYYGVPVYTGRVGLEQLAKEIEQMCSMTESDVMAVLVELISVMNDELNVGNKVKLDGLGTFQINMRSKGTSEEAKFGAENIRGAACIFTVERRRPSNSKKYIRAFCEDVKLEKWKYLKPVPAVPPAGV